ncbi:hypothetical protein FFY45_10120 [Xanthomonas hortorum]|nr:hypothetical protein [Xanthomonas hortorum]
MSYAAIVNSRGCIHPLRLLTCKQHLRFFCSHRQNLKDACTRAGVGPYAAWMPRKSLHGRTCGVSHAGTRASARSRPKHPRKTGRRRARR